MIGVPDCIRDRDSRRIDGLAGDLRSRGVGGAWSRLIHRLGQKEDVASRLRCGDCG
jgi:hypothetical protein